MPSQETIDRNTRAVKDALKREGNRRCADCAARGPTVACIAFRTFVCQPCANAHRELFPDNKLKSVSLAEFETDEVRGLRQHGNEASRKIWLARWSQSDGEPPAGAPREALKGSCRASTSTRPGCGRGTGATASPRPRPWRLHQHRSSPRRPRRRQHRNRRRPRTAAAASPSLSAPKKGTPEPGFATHRGAAARRRPSLMSRRAPPRRDAATPRSPFKSRERRLRAQPPRRPFFWTRLRRAARVPAGVARRRRAAGRSAGAAAAPAQPAFALAPPPGAPAPPAAQPAPDPFAPPAADPFASPAAPRTRSRWPRPGRAARLAADAAVAGGSWS